MTAGKGFSFAMLAPGALVTGTALLGFVKPLANVLTGRAGVRAGGGGARTPDARSSAPGLVREAGADVERDRERLLHHASSRSPKRRMFRSAIAWILSMTSVRGWRAEEVGEAPLHWR